MTTPPSIAGIPFEAFFHRYVYELMCPDISREVAAAHHGENASNFLCAIGLLTYTEVMGHFVPGPKRGSRNRFEAFFRRLGPCYAAFLDAGNNAYDLYRNGLVHQYLIKAPAAQIAMTAAGDETCGVGETNGVYYLVVERYFEDFVVACARLHEEVVGHRHSLIHIYAPHRLP